MLKRIVVCADGTWNRVEKASSGKHLSTNVAKLAAALLPVDAHGTRQELCYLEGVGTDRWEWFRGGAFGLGISRVIRRAYEFVISRYVPGDELWMFGFSRGAFTVRSLAGLIRNSGVLREDHRDRISDAMKLYKDRYSDTAPDAPRARIFRNSYSYEPPIKLIGVWDTVGSLGVPFMNQWLARMFGIAWQFHDTKLSRSVENAYHALAIHERRSDFQPTLWEQQGGHAPANQVLQQIWFSGVHCDVGGGYCEAGLSDISLLWMADRAASQGLGFREDFLMDRNWIAPNEKEKIHDSFRFPFSLLDLIRGKSGTREFSKDPSANAHEAVHPSVAARYKTGSTDLPESFRHSTS